MKHWNEESHFAIQKSLLKFVFFFLFRRTRKVAEGASEVDCALRDVVWALAAVVTCIAHLQGFLTFASSPCPAQRHALCGGEVLFLRLRET